MIPLLLLPLSLNFYNPFLTFLKNVHPELGRHDFVSTTTNMSQKPRTHVTGLP